MPPTPERTELGYHRMWDRCTVELGKVEPAKKIARAIIAHRKAYEAIEKATGVPWFMTGAIHSRESDLDFNTHLHNGDPLTARTRHVPAGRPKTGSPPFDFTASATDALTMPPHQLQKVSAWSTERILYELEKYNGWGYLGKGNSPYLWAWTSEYRGGKYVRDGVYDPRAWDAQAGCVALLKELAVLEPAVAGRLAHREANPPSEVNEAATRRERAARAGGVVGAGTGGANEAGKTAAGLDAHTEQRPQQSLFLPPLVAWSLIGIGVAVAIVATALIVRKKATILAKWSGASGTGPAV
jgi:lysozyme family protein